MVLLVGVSCFDNQDSSSDGHTSLILKLNTFPSNMSLQRGRTKGYIWNRMSALITLGPFAAFKLMESAGVASCV